jgi:hypothetical protein
MPGNFSAMLLRRLSSGVDGSITLSGCQCSSERLMPVHAPSYLLSPNLHVLTCRLPRQEWQRGPAANKNEYYLERYMLDPKARNAHRTTDHPEITHMRHTELADLALACFSLLPGCQTLDQLAPRRRERRGLFHDPDVGLSTSHPRAPTSHPRAPTYKTSTGQKFYNQAAVQIGNNDMSCGKTKYLPLHLHFLRECVENGLVELVLAPTEDQLADASWQMS